MTTQTLAPVPTQRFVDNNGNALVGGLLYSYQAGTSTPATTYTDSTGSTAQTNPIVLNARGECSLWIPPNIAYKFNLTDFAGNQIPGWPVDQVTNAQLLSLYGGTDVGSANAYVITYPSPTQSPYTDGTVIYWIAAHSNTGASTINVNGLGPVAIVKQDGTALSANNIFANQVSIILYQVSVGGFKLISSGNIAPSLFGGVSTNVSNAYSLSFSSQFGAYANGVLVYWIPNANNSGASTLNVNSLGAIPIINQNGSALGLNTLMINQVALVMYYGGSFLLLSTGSVPLNGTFTGTLATGLTTTPTATISYKVTGGQCTLTGTVTGTSNATGLTMTGVPAQCQPQSTSPAVPCQLTDNGANTLGWATVLNTTGQITFGLGIANNQAGFTSSSTKGLPANWTITYGLT